MEAPQYPTARGATRAHSEPASPPGEGSPGRLRTRGRPRAVVWPPLSAVTLALLLLAPWAVVARELLPVWRGDPAASHGPLILLLGAGLLALRLREVRGWSEASPAGLALLTGSGMLFVASRWADVRFLQPVALVGVTVGLLTFLGGARAFRRAAGAAGLLLFVAPWPTTLVDRIAFPMQLTSSAYAAMLTGMLGVPVERDGILLAVMPPGAAEPVFSVLVARQCSGLTSLTVLLALGYLLAYHTPVSPGRRMALFALVVPVALAANAVRLTLVLLAGTYLGSDAAARVHDYEAPILAALCMLALGAVRARLLASGPSGRVRMLAAGIELREAGPPAGGVH